MEIQFTPHEGSQVLLVVKKGYGRWPASNYHDKAAKLTPRQAAFYKNLIELALAFESGQIPVDFQANGQHLALDHGCIKIAEHARFIRPLVDGPNGVVDFVELSWSVSL